MENWTWAVVALFLVSGAYVAWQLFVRGEPVGEVPAVQEGLAGAEGRARLRVKRAGKAARIRVLLQVRVMMGATQRSLAPPSARRLAQALEERREEAVDGCRVAPGLEGGAGFTLASGETTFNLRLTARDAGTLASLLRRAAC